MTRTPFVCAVLLSLAPASALAHDGAHAPDPNLHVDPSVGDCSVRFSSQLSQPAFARFVREFGSVSAFKLMSPSTTLGRWDFDLAIEQIWFTVEEHSAAWNDTFVHPTADHELGASKAFPKLSAHLGLTSSLDVGAYFTKSLTANYGWLGVDAKYGVLRQTDEMPISLAVRGAYTKTLFIKDMDMHAATADVAVGRTFWRLLTPYVGLGSDLVLARETTDAVALDTEAQLAPHALGGVRVRYGHVALGAEGYLATIPSFQAQVAAVF